MRSPTGSRVEVALEVGPRRRVFAQVRDWIGWCRSGNGESPALDNLTAYRERYGRVAARAGLAFDSPIDGGDLAVVERVTGNAQTDFGAIGAILSSDTAAVDDAQVERLACLLDACWSAFDDALAAVPEVQRAVKPERGRSPDAMRLHVLETDLWHLCAFGLAVKKPVSGAAVEQEATARAHMLDGLRALPRHAEFVPHRRYGLAWTPIFAVRRTAWHALDHAWELEDRGGV